MNPATPANSQFEVAAANEPLSTTIGEIAALYDLPAGDVLDETIKAGCRSFWWNGKPYHAEGIRQLAGEWWRWDIRPEIEIDLSPDVLSRLQFALGGEEAADAATKPLRKFVASEKHLPALEDLRRRERFG